MRTLPQPAAVPALDDAEWDKHVLTAASTLNQTAAQIATAVRGAIGGPPQQVVAAVYASLNRHVIAGMVLVDHTPMRGTFNLYRLSPTGVGARRELAPTVPHRPHKS